MGDSTGHFTYSGKLQGHRGWVTTLACPQTHDGRNRVVTGSRDNTLVSWDLGEGTFDENVQTAIPLKRLEGHSKFVSDVALSSDAQFALSSSWDKSLRLWELKSGNCIRKFLDHTHDVLSVAFSPDNRQIVSGGRDHKLKMWNTLGECKYTIDAQHDGHSDWVSTVRFSPSLASPLIVSGGWDNMVKVWSLTDFRCQHTLKGHTGYVNTVCVSPDGSLCASAGKDGTAKLWDLTRGDHLYQLEAGETINQISFSPNRYWLCAATEKAVRIWDLESKAVVAELVPEVDTTAKNQPRAECVSLSWSADGSTLYTGYTDNCVRVWGVRD